MYFSSTRDQQMAIAGGVGSRRGCSVNPRIVKVVLAVMGLGIAVYILGPPLYWHLAEALLGRSTSSSSSYSGCPTCTCDCPSQPLISMPEELSNVSFTDCVKHDPDVKELEQSFTDLLSEELKLREAEAVEGQQHADVKLLEAKKVASQYQKEADKCNSGMETCEEARERAELALLEQRKLSALWETRAREKGWKDGNLDAAQR